MADRKYGRLFTEMDVMLVATAAAVEMLVRLNRIGEGKYDAPPTKQELLDIALTAIAQEDADQALTFPADEPLFLLRGQDAYAPEGVGDYLNRLNTGMAHRVAVEEARDAMIDWQRKHPDRVKVPD